MFTIPPLVKVFCIFGLVLLLNQARLTLSLCMLLGAVLLALWMQMPLVDLFRAVVVHVTDLQTVGLVVIVGLILVISRLMKESSQLERIVVCFSKLSGDDRASGAIMAALIGLLPMPGGALFSAPMVDAALENHSISKEIKTAINYWFRHIWEYWWPLYPGVVLAVALLEIPTWKFIAFMAPMTGITILAGYYLILKPLGQSPSADRVDSARFDIRSLLWEVMPIVIVIIVILALAAVIGILSLAGFSISIPGAISILPGLVGAMIWVCWVNHISFKNIRAALLDRKILPLILLVAAVMVFKGILTDSQAVFQIRDDLAAYGIPVALIIMIMPFISGFITGIAIGFVGLSFPLIIPLLPSADLFHCFAHVALAYSFGYMGMMLSPVHLCFIVTKDYYKASLIRCYRYVIPSALVVMVFSVLIFFGVTSF